MIINQYTVLFEAYRLLSKTYHEYLYVPMNIWHFKLVTISNEQHTFLARNRKKKMPATEA